MFKSDKSKAISSSYSSTPKKKILRVGENLSLRENGGDRGLIVQVIEFRTVNYPTLLQEMLHLVAEDHQAGSPDLSDLYPGGDEGLPEMSNLKLAIAKIRKVVRWTPQMTPEQPLAIKA